MNLLHVHPTIIFIDREERGVGKENNRTVAIHWQTLLHLTYCWGWNMKSDAKF